MLEFYFKALLLSYLFIGLYSFSFLGNSQKSFDNSVSRKISSDYIEYGKEITDQIKGQIKTAAQQAYIFNGNSPVKNVYYIQQKMNSIYPGNWFISVFSANNNTEVKIGQNVGISAYSLNNEWWIYWKGVNHYQPSWSYYLARYGNSTNLTNSVCFSNSNYTSTSDVFKNVVNAAQMDFRDIQNFTLQVTKYLHDYAPTVYPNVVAINTTISFFSCNWGGSGYQGNIIQRTDKQNLMVVSAPKI